MRSEAGLPRGGGWPSRQQSKAGPSSPGRFPSRMSGDGKAPGTWRSQGGGGGLGGLRSPRPDPLCGAAARFPRPQGPGLLGVPSRGCAERAGAVRAGGRRRPACSEDGQEMRGAGAEPRGRAGDPTTRVGSAGSAPAPRWASRGGSRAPPRPQAPGPGASPTAGRPHVGMWSLAQEDVEDKGPRRLYSQREFALIQVSLLKLGNPRTKAWGAPLARGPEGQARPLCGSQRLGKLPSQSGLWEEPRGEGPSAPAGVSPSRGPRLRAPQVGRRPGDPVGLGLCLCLVPTPLALQGAGDFAV